MLPHVVSINSARQRYIHKKYDYCISIKSFTYGYLAKQIIENTAIYYVALNIKTVTVGKSKLK